jgi:hypothetical protein
MNRDAADLKGHAINLTICYCTARRNCKIEWFLDSLLRLLDDGESLPFATNVVLVDFYAKERPVEFFPPRFPYKLVEPKPCVWQGKHRLTKEDWFAMANARNTGLCYAPDGWIAYVDDLSVLMPGWVNSVTDAIQKGYIGLGAYLKVRDLVVTNGRAESFKLQDKDGRWDQAASDLVSVGGDWMYGCSLIAPVQAFLDINGWGEALCDGLGFEDVCTGITLGNTNRYGFRYNRNMLTLESEEHHHLEPAFRKEDWHWEGDRPVIGGNGQNDKSHSALNQARGSTRFEQYFGNGFDDIGTLRQAILNGGEFPVRCTPEHDWYTRMPLREL